MINETVMMDYVCSLFENSDFHGGNIKMKINYSRAEHTKRVCMFAKRIYENYRGKDDVDYQVLITAAIFHDSGYSNPKCEQIPHAVLSEEICRKYLTELNFDAAFIEKTCFIILNHSNKELLHQNNAIPELVLLLEADLFDDTGAHGIVMDVWMESFSEAISFHSILEHIKKYTQKDMKHNPMKTEYSRQLWEEKRCLTDEFVRQLEFDLEEY